MTDENKKWSALFGPVGFVNPAVMNDGTPYRRLSVTVPNTEDGGRISCTLWPKFNDLNVEVGDWVAVEGPLSPFNTKDKNDNPVTYWNLSVQRVLVMKASETPNQAKVLEKRGGPNPNQRDKDDHGKAPF